MIYDVFISCKSEDYSKVEPIYHWLVKQGHHPFFAPISLKISTIPSELGVFGEVVDDALEQADNMVLFASKAEYVKQGYVRDEWRTFVEEQRAGRKSGSLVTILDGVNVADLPIRLRSVQSFTPFNYQKGILRFLGDAPKTLGGWDEPVLELEKKKDLTFDVGGVSFIMKPVEGGTFLMGAQKTDPYGQNYDGKAYDAESPVHSVSLNSFYMGETVVTQALWKEVMGSEPKYNGGWVNQYGKGDNYPAYRVSYNDIVNEFLPKLNQKTGESFRLPTEEEWEYAARGGNERKGYKYAGSGIISDVAWYYGNSGNKIHTVKAKSPNELGIYDMSGNVWEWCSDAWYKYESAEEVNPKHDGQQDSLRVLRGGGWGDNAKSSRVTCRAKRAPSIRGISFGFRLVLPK